MLHNDHEVIKYLNSWKVRGVLFNRINKRVNFNQENNWEGDVANAMDNSRNIAGAMAARTDF